MITENEIIRTPIKLRKSIHMDMCECWGTRRVHIDGELQYIIGDDFSNNELKKFLESTEYCVNVRFNEDIDICWEKIMMCLSYNVPVTLRTPRLVGSNRLQLMSEVLHCSIQADIELPTKKSGNSLGDTFWRERTVQPLREMLIKGKSWMMDTAAVFNFNIIDNSLFDVYEMLDYLKSGIGHIFLTFPKLEKEQYNINNNITKFYDYDENNSLWVAKEKYVKYIADEVNEFSSSKKIHMELASVPDITGGIVRYSSSGYSKFPIGMPQFIYKKGAGGKFYETEYPEEGGACPHCNKYMLVPTSFEA